MKIGDVAKKAIVDGASDKEALAAVLEAFPDAKTKIASVKWYRSQLRKQGKIAALAPRTPAAPRSGPMSDDLKQKLRDAAAAKKQKIWDERLEAQRKRQREFPSLNMASIYLAAARKWKRLYGFWPSPSDLQQEGSVPYFGATR